MKITCAVAFAGGERVAFGTDSGIHLAHRRPGGHTYQDPTHRLGLKLVTQLEVFEQEHILLAQADGCLFAFPLEGLLLDLDYSSRLKRGKKVCFCDHITRGPVESQSPICCAKVSESRSVIKIFPMDVVSGDEWETVLSGEKKVFQFREEVSIPFRVVAMFYTSEGELHLASNVGIQVLTLADGESKALLEGSDTWEPFVSGETHADSTYIEIIADRLLICRSNSSIYIDCHGDRAQRVLEIGWGEPCKTFATLMHKYIFAFKADRIQGRDSKTATVVYSEEYHEPALMYRGATEILFTHIDEHGCSVLSSARVASDERRMSSTLLICLALQQTFELRINDVVSRSIVLVRIPNGSDNTQ